MCGSWVFKEKHAMRGSCVFEERDRPCVVLGYLKRETRHAWFLGI